MPQARGTQTTIGLYEETVYSTDPGSPNGQKLYITPPFGLKSSQNLLDSNTLQANRERGRPVAGNIALNGPLNQELSAQDQGTILKHALGANTTTGANPYTHTMTLGDLPISMMIEKDHGANITGVGRFEKFNGSRIGSAQYDFPTEGFATASYQVIGAKSVLASTALDATLTDNGHTSFSMFEASILEGGGAIAVVESAQINLANDLDESSYVIGGLGIRRALTEGFTTVTGTLTALFEDTALLTKAINGTQSSLAITLSRGTGLGSAGNEFMSFTVNQLIYERTSPEISGPQGIKQSFNFKAFRPAGVSALTVVVKNAVVTI